MTFPKLKDNLAIQKLLLAKKENPKYQQELKDLEDRSSVLIINEVFETIQCEGKSMGKPVVFIRTYGCNLRCGFANPDGTRGCDTPYTWHKDYTESSDTNKYTPKMLVDEIMQYSPHHHWVITGGEPLLQAKKLAKLAREYEKRTGKLPYIEIETNGTLIPDPELQEVVSHYNVSLKLDNSNATEETGYKEGEFEYNWNTEKRRVMDRPVKWFNNEPKAYFKFVVDREIKVLPEIKDLQKRFNIPNSKVWLMPEGNSPEDIHSGSLPIVDICIKEGYTFSTRLHIILWGFKR